MSATLGEAVSETVSEAFSAASSQKGLIAGLY